MCYTRISTCKVSLFLCLLDLVNHSAYTLLAPIFDKVRKVEKKSIVQVVSPLTADFSLFLTSY